MFGGLLLAAAIGAGGLTGCRPPPAATFTLDFHSPTNDPTRLSVVVRASDAAVWPARARPEAWERVLALQLFIGNNEGTPSVFQPMLGSYEVNGRELRFAPRFPLLPGGYYEARFDAAALPGTTVRVGKPLTRYYQVPNVAKGPAPRLTAIHPSGELVPANHLKFYLVFSEPMRPGGIFKYFRLLDEQGGPVPDPFRETELWSADGRRLTLWFHPGRQKTGVNLNVEIGPILAEGRRYTLEISGDWPSPAGPPLGAPVRKPLRAGPPDHAQPDIALWQPTPPPAGTRAKLRVQFPKPLDWALLQSQLWVETAEGRRVSGRSEVGPGETSWLFEPEQPWTVGDFRLAIGTVLEDLAGNSLARPFQVDVQGRPLKKVADVVYLPFKVVN